MPIVAIAVKLTSPRADHLRAESVRPQQAAVSDVQVPVDVRGAETLQDALEDRNEATGPVFKIRDDPRITPVGRWLRNHRSMSCPSSGMFCGATCPSWVPSVARPGRASNQPPVGHAAFQHEAGHHLSVAGAGSL